MVDAEQGTADLCQQRFLMLLEDLERQGVTQREIAAQAKVPAQYVSDVKAGRRPMTELFARRLGEEFKIDHQWLLGVSGSMQPSRLSESTSSAAARRAWLPVLPHPIEGDPHLHPRWDGTSIELSGAAANKILLARHPYVLRFGADDRHGRLHSGDLILISQAENLQAGIHVIKAGRVASLARHDERQGWQRLATNQSVSRNPTIIGHALGIVWGTL